MLNSPSPNLMSVFLKRITLSALSIAMLMAPAAASAYGGTMDFDPQETGGIFQTPVMAKGRFVYVTKISRRMLRKMVAQTQHPYRPKVFLVTELL